jgi:hypothetical protein
MYIHPSLLVGSYFTVSQICRVTPTIKLHHMDPSMDRSIKIVQQLKQVFQPYHVMFKELKETKKQLP